MGTLLQIVFLTFTGLFLLWLGYTLFFAFPGGGASAGKARRPAASGVSAPAGGSAVPRACPVCCARLENGERVKSIAFPAIGSADRFMHISGCCYCLEGDRHRLCPVCGESLEKYDYLIARYYEKPAFSSVRSHVHVIGCTRCKLRRY